MKVHFVVHESFEAPGAYEAWATARGHQVAYSRVYLNEPLPPSAAAIDLLIVMGGPQSPATTMEECPHFDAAAECALIADCVRTGRAVVGVCLGAQLIGHALGASFERSPEKEIGVFPIVLTDAGKARTNFAHFGDELDVGHWHSDMPGLTDDATVIAGSAGCPRQIVEYTPLVYGFQCHMEFTPADVESLIAAESDLPALVGHRFVQQAEALRANDFADMNAKLHGFLDRLAGDYAGRTG
ncbi:MAG: type 1 glutamine amidotransferase [Luteibacter sp.]